MEVKGKEKKKKNFSTALKVGIALDAVCGTFSRAQEFHYCWFLLYPSRRLMILRFQCFEVLFEMRLEVFVVY